MTESIVQKLRQLTETATITTEKRANPRTPYLKVNRTICHRLLVDLVNDINACKVTFLTLPYRLREILVVAEEQSKLCNTKLFNPDSDQYRRKAIFLYERGIASAKQRAKQGERYAIVAFDIEIPLQLILPEVAIVKEMFAKAGFSTAIEALEVNNKSTKCLKIFW